MSAAIVWLNHGEAKIFRLMPGSSTSSEKMEASHGGHNLGNDQKKQHDNAKFFHEVAGRLEGLKEVLLVGPGTAKQEFRHHLDSHHHGKLAKAVVGVENADQLTEPQILAMGRKFFKSYDLYSGT